MKVVVVVAVVFFCSSMQGALCMKDFKEEVDLCIGQLNLDSTKIYGIHSGAGDVPPEDLDEYASFMQCLWEKIGFLKVNGEINRDAIWKMYYDIFREAYDCNASEINARSALERCNANVGNTPGQRAVHMGKCLKHLGDRK